MNTEQALARRGSDGYRQYRIPALAVSTRGTVLAAYDGRPNLDDLPSAIDLLLRRSFDGGRTWEPQQVVRTGTGLQGFGDPSLHERGADDTGDGAVRSTHFLHLVHLEHPMAR